MTLLVPDGIWRALCDLRLAAENEIACVGLANRVQTDRGTRFLLTELLFPSASDYQKQGQLEAELSPAFVASAVSKAKAQKQSLVFVHSHPFSDHPAFSSVDDAGEEDLRNFVERRIPDVEGHLAMVI